MEIRNVTRTQLNKAARQSRVRLTRSDYINQKGTRHRVRIGLGPKLASKRYKWQKVSRYGRRIASVCWHGHLVFMRRLYKLAPEAVIISGYHGEMRYESIKDLERDKWEVAAANVGNYYEPMQLIDACTCEEFGYDSIV